jgi:hypothetical protein
MNVIKFDKYDKYYEMYVNDIKCGTCSYIFLKDQPNIIHIIYLNILDEYKHMGCGTVLLYEVLNDAYHIDHMMYVDLDDVSDRCHKWNNIYIRMGLRYTQGKDDNNMKGNLRYILYGNKQYRSVYQERFSFEI